MRCYNTVFGYFYAITLPALTRKRQNLIRVNLNPKERAISNLTSRKSTYRSIVSEWSRINRITNCQRQPEKLLDVNLNFLFLFGMKNILWNENKWNFVKLTTELNFYERENSTNNNCGKFDCNIYFSEIFRRGKIKQSC